MAPCSKPASEERRGIERDARIGPAYRFILKTRFVELAEHLLGEAADMIVIGHRNIAAVAPDVDVEDLFIDRQTVEGQMRFEGAPVGLRFNGLDRGVDRTNPEIDPGIHRRQRPRFYVLMDEEVDDALHPRRTAFGISRDDDVARPRPIVTTTAGCRSPRARYSRVGARTSMSYPFGLPLR